MTIAVNDVGEALYLTDAGKWEPAKIAEHPQTKERLAFDGKEWSPIPNATTGGEAFKRGLLNSATFNFLDELGGVARAGGLEPSDPNVLHAVTALGKGAYRLATGATGASEAYNEQANKERARTKLTETEHPNYSLGGQVTGALALPVGLAGRAATYGAHKRPQSR